MKDEGRDTLSILHPSSFDPSSLITAALAGRCRSKPCGCRRRPSNCCTQLGIWRIGQLEALPRRGAWRRVSGRGCPALGPGPGQRRAAAGLCRPPPRFRGRWSPEYPTARRETIEAALEQSDRPAGGDVGPLRPRGLAVGVPAVVSAAEPPLEIAVGLFRGRRPGRERLFPLVQLQLERLRLPGPVRAMSVEATLTAPLECRQQELVSRRHAPLGNRGIWPG